MTIPREQILGMVFRRSSIVDLSAYANDIKTFNVLFALDGKRSVQTIAREDAFNLDELVDMFNSFLSDGLVEDVMTAKVSRGRAKAIIDAIIKKRSRGIGAITKSLKIKMALKGIHIDSLTPDTVDDPNLIQKLLNLAKKYGVHVTTKAEHSVGRTKLLLDSIITQRSGGDPRIAKIIKTKLMLKGINPDAYSFDTMDDPQIVYRLKALAEKLGVHIPTAKAIPQESIDKMF